MKLSSDLHEKNEYDEDSLLEVEGLGLDINEVIQTSLSAPQITTHQASKKIPVYTIILAIVTYLVHKNFQHPGYFVQAVEIPKAFTDMSWLFANFYIMAFGNLVFFFLFASVVEKYRSEKKLIISYVTSILGSLAYIKYVGQRPSVYSLLTLGTVGVMGTFIALFPNAKMSLSGLSVGIEKRPNFVKFTFRVNANLVIFFYLISACSLVVINTGHHYLPFELLASLIIGLLVGFEK
ncbi:MAG: hypothetical protein JNM93_08535 [Bacteriovoracaceae bacterium]|nr:hypothetical protein [Bacteriovoracaceae bacterium]